MRIVNVAKVLIRRSSDGKYLLLRSSKWEERQDRSQKPDLAGGVVEPGETIPQGAAREVFEEAGLVVDPKDLELVYALTFKSDHDGASINRSIFFTEVNGSPEVTLSTEHEEFWWATKDELLQLEIRQPYEDIFAYLNDVGILN